MRERTTAITVSEYSGGSKNFAKKGRKTIYQPRPHLLQMHTTIYRPFTRKKAAVWKKIEPIGGGAVAPTAPPLFESATVLM